MRSVTAAGVSSSRIRIDVASSNFPRYDRNRNAGEGLDGTETVSADQTIYHDAAHPSSVELPVVPVESLARRIVDGPIGK